MASQPRSTGKEIDRSTPWSEYTWDQRGFYYMWRYDPDGKVQYYHPPSENEQTNQTPRRLNDESPPTDTQLNDERSTSPNSQNYTHTTPPQQTFATPAGNIPRAYGTKPTTSSQSFQQAPVYPVLSDVSYTARPGPSSNPYFPAAIFSGGNTQPQEPMERLGRGIENLVFNQTSPSIPEEGPYATPNEIPGRRGGASRSRSHRNDNEKLDDRYQIIANDNLNKFWKVGRVFAVLWTEPARDNLGNNTGSQVSETFLHGKAYTEIRRYVVLAKNHGNVVCSPIHTYNNRGCLKPNLADKQQHAIIHTSVKPPEEQTWYNAETGITEKEDLAKDPIRVISERDDDEGELGIYSRVNYSKVYTIEFYLRVLNIGMVASDDMGALNFNSRVKQGSEKDKKHGRSGKKEKGGNSRGGTGASEKGQQKNSRGNSTSVPGPSQRESSYRTGPPPPVPSNQARQLEEVGYNDGAGGADYDSHRRTRTSMSGSRTSVSKDDRKKKQYHK